MTKAETIIIEYYKEPKTMLEQNVNALSDRYEEVIKKLREEYNKNLGTVHEMARMNGSNLIEVDK